MTGKVKALQPDLIADCGPRSPRYADLAQASWQHTGVPTVLLDGALVRIPDTFRILGGTLHRRGRAENLAGSPRRC